ncbi:MAG: MipA/OmpV family protein [Caldimonas sp.]
MSRTGLWACGFAVVVLAAPACAADEAVSVLGGQAERPAPAPLWELGAGVAALNLPDYRGSDQSRTYVLPLPYVVYRGDWLRADRDGARALLLRTDRVTVDVSVAASVRTRSRDNVARQGMPDLPATVEVGPNANVELLQSSDRRVRLDLRLPLRAAVSIQRSPQVVGTTFSPNLNLDVKGLAGGWNLGALAGPLYADRRYHEHFYGVDAPYATAARPEYRAPGGYAGWRSLAAASRRFGNAWVGAFVRYDSLRNAAFESSPLLRRDHDVTGGIGISWVFATSSRLVVREE